mgnify:CR=1
RNRSRTAGKPGVSAAPCRSSRRRLALFPSGCVFIEPARRLPPLLLILLLAAPVGAQELRYVDHRGVIHLTNAATIEAVRSAREVVPL